MKIDGKEIQSDQLVVIATTPDQATHQPGVPVGFTPCGGCGRLLQIDGESAAIIAKGSPVSCILCAVARWPNMIAGRDPDTGRPMTLREMTRQPNTIGAYRQEDVKEI